MPVVSKAQYRAMQAAAHGKSRLGIPPMLRFVAGGDARIGVDLFTGAIKPVDLGSDGSTPTGTAPIMYFSRRNGASTWGDNKGSGGTFTQSGTFLAGSDSPSD